MEVSNYLIVIVYDLDESIVLSLGPSIKQLVAKMGGEIATLNTPADAPPPIPRVAIKIGEVVIKFSLDRMDLNIIPPDHIKDDINKSSKFTMQKISSILGYISNSLPNYNWSGIVVDLDYPSDKRGINSGIDAVKPIFEKLIDIESKGKDLSSFQFNVGFRDAPYFVNYIIDGYETRDFKFAGDFGKSKFIRIDKSEMKITKCGVRIKIDVNTKPNGITNRVLSDIEITLSKVNELSATLSKDLNLEGVL